MNRRLGRVPSRRWLEAEVFRAENKVGECIAVDRSDERCQCLMKNTAQAATWRQHAAIAGGEAFGQGEIRFGYLQDIAEIDVFRPFGKRQPA